MWFLVWENLVPLFAIKKRLNQMKQALSIHGNGVTSTFESDICSIESIQPFAAKYRFNQYQTQGFCDIVRSIHRLILCVIVTDTTQRVTTETIRHVGLPRLLCFIAKLGTVGDYIYIDKSRGMRQNGSLSIPPIRSHQVGLTWNAW